MEAFLSLLRVSARALADTEGESEDILALEILDPRSVQSLFPAPSLIPPSAQRAHSRVAEL
jgi:hypothetical protein